MMIPEISLPFAYRQGSDHATFSTPIRHATLADGLVVVEWCYAQFGSSQIIDDHWLTHGLGGGEPPGLRWGFRLITSRPCRFQDTPGSDGFLGLMVWRRADVAAFRLAFATTQTGEYAG